MTETPDTDDADVSQLETRIDELEATIRKMLPSRREAIGMGVAGLAGASLMSGTASAGSAQVGTIGDASNQVDLVAEDVTITDTLNTASISGAAAGEALLSDGSGNLTFGSGGGGILRNGSEIDYVALDVSNLPASTGSGDVALVTESDRYVEDNPVSGTPFDITSSQFSFQTAISAQDSAPTGIAWNNDGSRLYEVGSSSDEIYQYNVSTPFDITTASFSLSINSQDSNPTDITWNNDGSKLYQVDADSDRIYESSLSVPFDINTVSSTTSISADNSVTTGIRFNDTGTSLYEVGFDGDEIIQYNLGTAFDITTASKISTIIPEDGNAQGITWNNDGSRFYEVGNSSDEIYQYTVGTAFDITTATFQTSVQTQDSFPTGIVFDNNGSRLYEVGRGSGGDIYQYTISTGGWEAL